MTHCHRSLNSTSLNNTDSEIPTLGGGPLAANLARHGHKVLLLEAGDDQGQNLNEKIPFFWPAASEDPTMRWDFFVKHYADEKQAAKDPKMYVIRERSPIQCCVGRNSLESFHMKQC